MFTHMKWSMFNSSYAVDQLFTLSPSWTCGSLPNIYGKHYEWDRDTCQPPHHCHKCCTGAFRGNAVIWHGSPAAERVYHIWKPMPIIITLTCPHRLIGTQMKSGCLLRLLCAC